MSDEIVPTKEELATILAARALPYDGPMEWVLGQDLMRSGAPFILYACAKIGGIGYDISQYIEREYIRDLVDPSTVPAFSIGFKPDERNQWVKAARLAIGRSSRGLDTGKKVA